jgi:hypothetical protein
LLENLVGSPRRAAADDHGSVGGKPFADTITVVLTVPLPGASETSALLTSTFVELKLSPMPPSR